MSFSNIQCRIQKIFGRSNGCLPTKVSSISKHHNSIEEIDRDGIEKRGGTAPDGLVLADWQTYLSYVTTINDTPYTVTTIANLPLTYYGASIPLGDGWTYGGLTSPTGTDNLAPPLTASPTPAGENASPTITSSTASGPSAETSAVRTSSTSPISSNSPSPSSTSLFSASSASSISTRTTSTSSSAATKITSASSTTSFAPDTINPNPTLDPTQPLPTNSSDESGRNLLAPLLGALVPLVVTLVVLLVFFCVYQKNRHNRDSRFFSIFSKSKWSSISPGPPTVTKGKSREIGETQDENGVKSPNEKSALLPGWTPQHHRNSSTIERRDEQEVDDELRDLAKQNNSLLQRLNLGLGWLTPSGSSGSSGSSGGSGNRKASGNTLEKGQGKRIFSPSTLATAAASGLIGLTSSSRNGNKRMTNTTSSSGTNEGYERVLEDDQLFFSVPKRNESSTGSRSRTGSATGTPSIPSHISSSQDYTSTSNRFSPPAEMRGISSTNFNIGIPDTPNTDIPDLSMDLSDLTIEGNRRRARWSEDGERINFPVPPGIGSGLGLYDDGTFGRPPRLSEGGEEERRESYLSGETDYYSAPSHSSSSHIPSAGVPIPRDTEEYRHVSVSAFGSHPSTPTRPTRFSQLESSSFHQTPQSPQDSPVKLVSPLASPSKAKAIPQRPVSGIGSTFHSIRNLFSSTPTPSPGIHGDHGSSEDKRRSYIGQPIVDDKLRRTDRSIGEFGEPLKQGAQGALVASTMVSPTPSHSSEQASVHLSIPSQYHSHSSHTTSGSSNDPTEASHEPALRGKRSKGMLLRASKIGELHRPLPLPLQSQQASSSSNRVLQLRGNREQERTREWEENIDEFMGEGEELPPLTPDRNGVRDKGLRSSWLGKWSGS